jgi:hypothetical protein
VSYYASEPPTRPDEDSDDETYYQRQEPRDEEGEWCDEGAVFGGD